MLTYSFSETAETLCFDNGLVCEHPVNIIYSYYVAGVYSFEYKQEKYKLRSQDLPKFLICILIFLFFC